MTAVATPAMTSRTCTPSAASSSDPWSETRTSLRATSVWMRSRVLVMSVVETRQDGSCCTKRPAASGPRMSGPGSTRTAASRCGSGSRRHRSAGCGRRRPTAAATALATPSSPGWRRAARSSPGSTASRSGSGRTATRGPNPRERLPVTGSRSDRPRPSQAPHADRPPPRRGRPRVLAGYRRTAGDRGRGQARPFGGGGPRGRPRHLPPAELARARPRVRASRPRARSPRRRDRGAPLHGRDAAERGERASLGRRRRRGRWRRRAGHRPPREDEPGAVARRGRSRSASVGWRGPVRRCSDHLGCRLSYSFVDHDLPWARERPRL